MAFDAAIKGVSLKPRAGVWVGSSGLERGSMDFNAAHKGVDLSSVALPGFLRLCHHRNFFEETLPQPPRAWVPGFLGHRPMGISELIA